MKETKEAESVGMVGGGFAVTSNGETEGENSSNFAIAFAHFCHVSRQLIGALGSEKRVFPIFSHVLICNDPSSE